MPQRARKPWSQFVEDVSEFTHSGVLEMFRQCDVNVKDDDMLDFVLVDDGTIEITHLGSEVPFSA